MPETRRLKLIVSYDGRDFAGWQSQKHGNTIQDRIEQSFAKISGRRVAVIGAGRTDAGVHAFGQCAHVDVPAEKFSEHDWRKALNGVLPLTIRILRARFVSEEFHARFSARAKLYRYRVANTDILSPFEIGRAWHVIDPVDFELLEKGAPLFIGRHDFASFAASRGKAETDTIRTVESIHAFRVGGILTIEIWGDGFLYKMVRMLIAALVQCALGKAPLEEIASRLTATPQSTLRTPRLVAPAEGLYLVRVRY